jgi:hypothetical protein
VICVTFCRYWPRPRFCLHPGYSLPHCALCGRNRASNAHRPAPWLAGTGRHAWALHTMNDASNER